MAKNRFFIFKSNLGKRETEGLPNYKPGYVGSNGYRLTANHSPGSSFIFAVYPPAAGEQPLIAGILDLATHKACGS